MDVSLSTLERFWAKVEKTADCWIWRGAIQSHGYGNFYVRPGLWMRAHRLSYELLIGPIPDGLVLDHLCRKTACVNPAHLEAVTNRENTMRGVGPLYHRWKNIDLTECKWGHPLSGDNLYVQPKNGYRYCRTCSRNRQAAYQARRKAQAA